MKMVMWYNPKRILRKRCGLWMERPRGGTQTLRESRTGKERLIKSGSEN